jgi:hypothetical protein
MGYGYSADGECHCQLAAIVEVSRWKRVTWKHTPGSMASLD